MACISINLNSLNTNLYKTVPTRGGEGIPKKANCIPRIFVFGASKLNIIGKYKLFKRKIKPQTLTKGKQFLIIKLIEEKLVMLKLI